MSCWFRVNGVKAGWDGSGLMGEPPKELVA
jgi:hypothetical protein